MSFVSTLQQIARTAKIYDDLESHKKLIELFRHEYSVKSIPFMEYYEIELICFIIKYINPHNILEWGSGNSTLFFPHFIESSSIWHSVDHIYEWYNKIKLSNNHDNVKHHYILPNNPKFINQQLAGGTYDDFRDYIDSPLEYGPFDLILIDGRARNACLEKATERLSPGGIVILHDANRIKYWENTKQYKHQGYLLSTTEGGGGVWMGSNDIDFNNIIVFKNYSYLKNYYRSIIKPVTSSRNANPLEWEDVICKENINLYAGDIPEDVNYKTQLIGLSLTHSDFRHIQHDITTTIPLHESSTDFFQAEDVFEHIAYDQLLPVLNEIHRILKPGALFRLSVPDYRCDILHDRSDKDSLGNIVFDPFGGGRQESPGHVWFPRIDNLRPLLEASRFGADGTITFLHYYDHNGEGVTHPIDYSKGHVQRTPDFDPRVQSPYRPMSMVVDLTKGTSVAMTQNVHAKAETTPASNTKLVKISFVMIVLNGMPFIEYALKAIYDEAHEIIIVEGAVEKCLFAANPDGSSKDGTVGCISSFSDPYRKIRLIQGRWPEKCEMQNAALKHVTGNYVWLVDSDEIYKRADIGRIRSLLAGDPTITQVNFIPDNFWKGFDYLFVSPRFLEPANHYRRLFKFKPGSHFTTHRPPTMVWPGLDIPTEQMKLLDGATTRKMGIYPYHYSYVLDSQVRQKIELYRRYGWGDGWSIDLEKWYREFFRQWTPENSLELERLYPIWTGDPCSYSVPFTGTHPDVMEYLIAASKANIRKFKYDVYFDLNDGCNLDCVMCGGRKKAHEQYVMSFAEFSDHLLPMLRGADHYQFGCQCEPLMVPYFTDAVATLPEQSENGPQGRIVTNATLLNSKNIQAVVDRGIFQRVLISMDGATPFVYEQIRRGAQFNNVINNIQALIARAKEQNPTVSIEFIFTILRGNYRELTKIVRLASNLGVRRIGTHKHVPNDTAFVDDEFYENVTSEIAQAKELARQLGVELVDPGYLNVSQYEAICSAKSASVLRCNLSLNSRVDFIIDCKGTITTPCRRVGMPIGNILHAPLEEIIAGKAFQQLVACIDNPNENVCASCYLFQEVPLDKDKPTPLRSNLTGDFLSAAPITQHVSDAITSLKGQLNTRRPRNVKIAGEVASAHDLTAVDKESEFARAIKELFAAIRPARIIETGTYHGEGTTRIIAETLLEQGLNDAHFYSIECNPANYQQAMANLASRNLNNRVSVLHGLSVPRTKLPSIQEIEENCVNNIEFDDIFVDHAEQQRALLYYRETDFSGLVDDLLGKVLATYHYRPDFVLLDSGGHMGNVEFNYLISLIQGECYLGLDDIFHIKHHKSFKQMQADPRFTIVTVSDEKFGFCIARFNPGARVEPTVDKRWILWIRPDSIGDNILAMATLPYLKARRPDAAIAVFCQEHIAELYEACPAVEKVITFSRSRALQDEAYRVETLRQLQELRADICLNSVYSRDMLADFFSTHSGAQERIALRGDLVNTSTEEREAYNRLYTSILTSAGEHKPEIGRHQDFLRGIGITDERHKPSMWTFPDDSAFSDRFFKEQGFEPEKTIALFAGAQYDVRLYDKYGAGLAAFCREMGFSVVALGSADDYGINQHNLNAIGVMTANLSGATTLRQGAAILSRCRLAVGAETGLAHMACAVGTPNIIVLGGGHFGRFIPYSPLTSVVCLPLECYGCNWRCRYERVHCVRDVNPAVIVEALRHSLAGRSDHIRYFVQGGSLWKPEDGGPKRDLSTRFMSVEGELIVVENTFGNCLDGRYQ
jgi:ADP-heptose:LPS heptosyltransferase/predicted O-methyltransferase YrrM/sulfatase maturation enzyme AslB (radical SAM superfamily)/SAM-dependent methyltransferase